MKKRLLVILGLLLITNGLTYFFARSAEDQTSQPYPESETVDREEPVATINEEPVHFDDWMRYLENEYGKVALEDLITDRVAQEISDEENISIEPRLIDLEVAHMHTIHGQLSEEEAAKQEVIWREQIKSRLLTEALFARDVEVDDNEVDAYYIENDGDFDFNRRLEISEIRVGDAETAQAIYQELEEGANFNALAREHATDEETLENGGYLGFYADSSTFLSDDYISEVTALSPYSYSEPFSENGQYILVYLHRDIEAIQLAKDEVTDHIRRQIALETFTYMPDRKSLWDEQNVEWIY
ncbi:parvulin-like peptidyl-prolyl isomerase [Streptohalobacillus salinus]|uniref:peptidylprolyl isomerase n=1 Tax=Streptohalobacillus salinus TaxID=621096 RepID=A0A2V3W3D1_9BACI|nr:peptidyl-prolyl cis-trans isomerase [Streptohalobacillus salinus]PXW88440.1 parvulin-like peptidyl-prolyl isomerase [Streptohalobacillus salinus]